MKTSLGIVATKYDLLVLVIRVVCLLRLSFPTRTITTKSIMEIHSEYDYYTRQQLREFFIIIKKWSQVLLHSSADYPTFNQNDIFVSKSMETYIEIQNLYNKAHIKVKNLPIELRDCIFWVEKSLPRFVRYTYEVNGIFGISCYKTYTHFSNKNCLLQCRIDRVLKNCGCISYYLPSNKSEICSPGQFPCSFRSRSVGKGS